MIGLMRYFFVLCATLFFSAPLYAQNAHDYLRIGNDAFKDGAYDQAVVDYTKAIDLDPNSAKAYNNRGVAYAQEGSLTRAIDDFTMAIACNPKDAEAYNNRGLAYTKENNLSQALFNFTRAIETDTFYSKAYNNRALVYYGLKEYQKAWGDVHTVQAIGGKVDPYFIVELIKADEADHLAKAASLLSP